MGPQHSRISDIKDLLFIIAAGGTLLVGGAKFVVDVRDIPDLKWRVARVEHQNLFLVQGMEALTGRKYKDLPKPAALPDPVEGRWANAAENEDR